MELLSILIKSSIILSAFLLIYYMLMHKSSHFNINRAFLLIGLVTTIIISTVTFTYPVYVEMTTPQIIDPHPFSIKETTDTKTIINSPEENTTNYAEILTWLYICISGIFFLRLILSITLGLKLVLTAKKIKWRNTYVHIHPDVKNPMVFGNKILVGDRKYLQSHKEQILIHEKIHKEHNHWIDIFISEILLLITWFNPLTYIYRKTVLNNLEYIADRGVLNTGMQLNTYMQSILCETMGSETIVLANHFRTSQNKLRLKMMKNVKQSKWGKCKILSTLPLLGIILWAFSEPEYIPIENSINQTSVLKGNEIAKGQAILADTIEVLQEDGTYITHIINGDVSDINVVIKGSTIGSYTDKDGNFEIQANKGDILVFSHIVFQTKEIEYTGQDNILISMDYAKPRMLNPGHYRDKYYGKTNTKINLEEINQKSSISKDGETYMAIEELPKYKYGIETFFAQLYSSSAKLASIKDLKGSAIVKFKVDENGEIVSLQAYDNNNTKLKNTAIQIIKNLNNWTPAMQRGKAMPFNYLVKVEF